MTVGSGGGSEGLGHHFLSPRELYSSKIILPGAAAQQLHVISPLGEKFLSSAAIFLVSEICPPTPSRAETTMKQKSRQTETETLNSELWLRGPKLFRETNQEKEISEVSPDLPPKLAAADLAEQPARPQVGSKAELLAEKRRGCIRRQHTSESKPTIPNPPKRRKRTGNGLRKEVPMNLNPKS